MSTHPQVIEKGGCREFVEFPYEELLQMQAAIEDYEDIKVLCEKNAAAHAEPARSLDTVLKEIEA